MSRISRISAAVAVYSLLALASIAVAGSLTPPGAPAPTMKPLDQIEPRTAIKQADIPLTIATAGSYYFTGNLASTASNANAITITADNVTIDLSGFTLTGPGKTAGTTGAGIYTATNADCMVKNGSVTGFRASGVSLLGGYGIVSEIRTDLNGSTGIATGAKGAVRNCMSKNNGSDSDVWGISVGQGSSVEGNTCDGNQPTSGNHTGGGITCLADCKIVNNSCCLNVGYAAVGIQANGLDCQVRGNVCNENSASGVSGCFGIETNDGAEVSGNTCSNNKCSSDARATCGIYVGDDCHVRGNVCNSNQGGIAPAANGFGYGVFCSGVHCVVVDNTCNLNTGKGSGWGVGIYAWANSRIDSNHCADNICPAPNNHSYGIVVAGNRAVVISNTCTANIYGVYFLVGTTNGYAAANLIDQGSGIWDPGTSNNINATSPAANAFF
jgi:hypothetical protein